MWKKDDVFCYSDEAQEAARDLALWAQDKDLPPKVAAFAAMTLIMVSGAMAVDQSFEHDMEVVPLDS